MWAEVSIATALVAWFGLLVSSSRRGRIYPRDRALTGLLGFAGASFALSPTFDRLAHQSLTWHMAQHLVLVFWSAPCVAFGGPVELFLAATGLRLTRRALRSLPARLMGSPVAAWCAFVGGLYVIHLTSVFELSLEHPVVHALEHASFLLLGIWFWLPVFGRLPARRIGEPARLLYVAAAAPPQAFLALVLYSAALPLYPAYVAVHGSMSAALGDQRSAALLMWLAGGAASSVAILALALVWKRAETARQRTLEEAWLVSA